jgi:hypothetical protein
MGLNKMFENSRLDAKAVSPITPSVPTIPAALSPIALNREQYQCAYYQKRKSDNPSYNRDRYQKLKARRPTYHAQWKRAWRAKRAAELLRQALLMIHR